MNANDIRQILDAPLIARAIPVVTLACPPFAAVLAWRRRRSPLLCHVPRAAFRAPRFHGEAEPTLTIVLRHRGKRNPNTRNVYCARPNSGVCLTRRLRPRSHERGW
jgi:hypothetical protein